MGDDAREVVLVMGRFAGFLAAVLVVLLLLWAVLAVARQIAWLVG